MPPMNARWLGLWLVGAALLLGACSGGGAVVFAPTPLPPDESPLVYTHPSSAFSLEAPRRWSLHEQYTTQLATAAFSPPGSDEPLLLISAVNLGDSAGSSAFSGLINRYQTQARPDAGYYTETGRAAMSDGSWRISGYRTLAGGRQQPLNTFIELEGPLMVVTEIVLPDDTAALAAIEAAANSLRLTPPGSLEPADLSAFSAARPADLGIVHTAAWTSADGVFYITGEVVNSGVEMIASAMVEVLLLAADGTPLTGAVDPAMGHVIPPGGFAPFSLRFGGGQPETARGFRVSVSAGEPLNGVPADAGWLTWTDSATFEPEALLTVSGEVTNAGSEWVREVRVAATVFDAAQHVIGAAHITLQPPTLGPGESAPYRIVFNELGGAAVNYIVTVQGLKDG